jgi:hypothetical protein
MQEPCMLSMTSRLAVFKSHFGICFICGIKQHGKFGSSCSFEIKVSVKLHAPTNSTQKLKLSGRGEQCTYTHLTPPLTCSPREAQTWK